MKKHFLGFCLAASLCGLAVAQQAAPATSSQQEVVPRLIRFTGQVKEDAGKTVGITFTLHKTQQDNAALWIETQSVKLDSEGKYSILLGATKAQGIPAELFTSGEAQWLGVRVEGKPEQPRVLMVSVPYALKAAEAETLAGHTATEFVTSDKLNTAVKEQLQQQSSGSSTVKKGTGVKPNVISSTATNFIDSTTNQVVLVQQNSTGAAIKATSSSGYAINASASTGSAILASAPGTTGATYAVVGTNASTSGTGLRGNATATTGTNYGVSGTASAPTGFGVYGISTATSGNGTGVYGRSYSPTGAAIRAFSSVTSGSPTGILSTIAASGGSAAVFQNTASGKLISGQAGSSNTEVFSVSGSGVVHGAGEIYTDSNMYAPWGWWNYGNGVAGYMYNNSTTSTSPTLYLLNYDSTSAADLVFDAKGNYFGGECTIDVSGNLFCTGTLGPAVAVNGKTVGMYTMQTPENLVEDFGSATLVNGVAKINIDSQLGQVMGGATGYRVFVTPAGDCEGLYITNRTATSFEVHELRGGKSNVSFDYRIVGHRRGFEAQRMPDVTARFGNTPGNGAQVKAMANMQHAKQ